jgi:hypothetical protein
MRRATKTYLGHDVANDEAVRAAGETTIGKHGHALGQAGADDSGGPEDHNKVK